jgi:translation initiation factor IF-1
MRKLSFFFFVTFLLPALGHAQESCPWLNPATASGALDGFAELAVTHPNANHKGDVTCDFTKQQGSITRELRIEVQTITKAGNEYAVALEPCKTTPTVLKAVGNEAMTCSLDGDKQRAEQVVGRMRDRVFIVRIKTNDTSWAPPELLREKARNVAELVAGNLF